MRANLTHPLRAVFGNLINFSPEHPGGILKLVDETDAKTLERVLPMQSFKEEGLKGKQQPNLVKGSTYDNRISSALTRAKDLPIDDIKGIKDFVMAIYAEVDTKAVHTDEEINDALITLFNLPF